MPKEITDNDIKKKAVKLVVAHIRKKITSDFELTDELNDWLTDMDELLLKEGFIIGEYYEMRTRLNEVVDGMINDEFRFKLRDSWYSYGKALEKKKKPK